MITSDIIVLVILLIVLSILSLVVLINYKAYKPINRTNFLGFTISVIFQFFIIISLCWLILVFAGFLPSAPSTLSSHQDSIYGYKKAFHDINEIIMIDNQVEEGDVGNCTNEKTLAEIFIRRINIIMNVIESYKSPNKQTLKVLEKDKLSGKPYVIFADGMLYIIEKVKGKCGTANSSNPDDANCVVIVDINGTKPPNELSTGNQEDNYKFKDRYRIIILKDKAIPASNSENNIAASIINK